MSFPVLFPGVVKVSTLRSSLLADPALRLHESRRSILAMISKRLFDKIVVVDGSGVYLFSDDEIRLFADQGICVEQLVFVQDSMLVGVYGKSYGECTLIEYAIAKSKLIRSSGGFFKLTPRYFFENIDCIFSRVTCDNLFFGYNPWPINYLSPFICTIFYKVTLDFYSSCLAGSISECSHDRDGYLESVFFRRLATRSKEKEFLPFPRFSGIAGTTAAPIKNRYHKLRDIASRAGFLAYSYR